MAKHDFTFRTIQTTAAVTSALLPEIAARWLESLFLTPRSYPTPRREVEWMASARREDFLFDAERRVPIYVWGEEGPTVLLVHGWSGRSSQLGVYAAPLREQGFRVVAFDAPAHGQADGRVSSLPEFAAALERVAARVGPVEAVIAHSMGAAATTIALSRGLTANRLVYLAPPENLSGYLARLARFMGFPSAIAERTQRRIEGRYGLPFEDARGSSLAPRMRRPLLAVHDEGDREVPYGEGRYLTDLWPGAELMTTEGLGHHRIVRDDAVVAAAVRFLS